MKWARVFCTASMGVLAARMMPSIATSEPYSAFGRTASRPTTMWKAALHSAPTNVPATSSAPCRSSPPSSRAWSHRFIASPAAVR